MKIYAVEFYEDYLVQLGFSTSREVAEQKAKEFFKDTNQQAFVTIYTSDKEGWIEFD